MRLIARSGLLRSAIWIPTTFSTALPAIATMTSPTNSSDRPSVAIAGRSASTNQSETRAAPSARGEQDAEREPQRPDIELLDRRLDRARSRAATDRERHRGREHDEQDDRDEDADLLGVAGVRRTRHRRQGRHRERGDREHQQHRHRADRLSVEPLRAVAQAAEEEGEPEHEQRVGEDRADERRLHHDDEPRLQAEDRDEELGQVAQRRLEDAGRARAEAVAELIRALADEAGQAGQGDRADHEDDDMVAADLAEDERCRGRDDGHRPEDRGVPAERVEDAGEHGAQDRAAIGPSAIPSVG